MKRKRSEPTKTAKGKTGRKSTTPMRRSVVSKTGTSQKRLAQISPTLAAAIKTATAAIKRNDGIGIINVLEPFTKTVNKESSEAREAHCALLAYGNAIAHRFADAEQIAETGLQQWADSLDLRYVLAFTKLSLRDYAQAIDAAVAFRRIYETYPEAGRCRMDFSHTVSHLSQVCNILGSAYIESRQDHLAEHALLDAIAIDSGNNLPYLNLSRLYARQGKKVEADAILERGIKSARQVQELRMLAGTQMGKSTISVCMIVKNEEQLLAGCLESVRDWVDEIIVVDTGSTDKTVEIAKSYGARVFHQQWEGNFSKHRNYSLELASCDWILIIDADERVESEDVPRLRTLLNQTEFQVLSLSVFNVYGEQHETATFLPSIRMFRRSLNLRYEGIVHNMLYVPDEYLVARIGARIRHLGYSLSPEKMAKKIERTKALLEKQLADNPKNAFAHFNYAQLLRGSKEGDRTEHIATVLHSAAQAVKLTDSSQPRERHIHLMALNQLAWTYFFSKDFAKAVENCERALAAKSGYLDPLILLGHIYIRTGDLEKSARYYQQYLDEQAKYQPHLETDNIILHHPDSRPSALYGLAMIANTGGDELLTRTLFEQIAVINDHYLDVNVRLGKIYLQTGDLEKAGAAFERQLKYQPEDRQALLGLATVYVQTGNTTKAKQRFEAILVADPQNLYARLQLGHLFLQQGKRSEAVHHFAEAVKWHDPELVVETVITELRTETGNHNAAIKLYTALADEGVRSARLFTELGNCYFKTAHLDQAEHWFAQAFTLNSESDVVMYNLGLTRARMGNYQSALELLTKYFEVTPTAIDVAHVIGDIYFKMKQPATAVAYYEHVLTEQPSDANVLLKLSDCYLHMGYADSARLGYQRVLQLDPKNKEVQKRLDDIQVRAESGQTA